MRIPAILAGSVLAVLASHADATTINTAGAICTQYNAGDIQYIDNVYSGVRTISQSATDLMCPAPRNAGGGPITIHIDVTHSGTQTTRCAATTYDYDGTPITSKSVTLTGSGHLRASASFTAAQNPVGAFSNVYCNIPAYMAGVLNGVTTSY